MKNSTLQALMLAIVLLLTVPASVAEGAAAVHQLNHKGRTAVLIIDSKYSADMNVQLIDWAEWISQALLQVFGHWPRNHWQMTASPVSAGSPDPIPWAQIRRGDIDKIEFYTASHATSEELIGAWTSYHELSHLLIPYRGWGDLWFSEGLATYYQNVIQARVGLISEQEMWQEIYDGFLRGRATSGPANIDLKTMSSELRQKGGYMRVYWSGAWYFLAADLRLRQQSGGKRTLDTALEQLNRCCADKKMSVTEMVQTLDRENKLLLFHPLFLDVRASTELPPFEDLFASMGITIANGRVNLQSVGPGAELRSQIAARKAL
ncbi:MAG: hypothetical protein ACI9B9_000994 [Halioglobus sp.]|jgi:hypothetical protein